ncbi:phosphoglycolate phosphatase-like HAD superfamily hydrolase [Pararhizobium capsulatum DSM 1112]|uniref:Phosphoglycolate phosphatase-like HAD superfamily hydrolase n=1 Tax=Pararhizobium capsulatum DSM 1112 TaxID=1121113 RepID=A0ABU0BP03_9HYPH|nr:phosphoglycolate phosphatase-like HAD superfamily hydrolase [Pararhizobium capsulatum DSM 1112]
MQLVLFDCDGTLVDSAGLIHEVMSRTFVDFNLPRPQLSETKGVIGLTLDIAIARMRGIPHVDDQSLAMTAHTSRFLPVSAPSRAFRSRSFRVSPA